MKRLRLLVIGPLATTLFIAILWYFLNSTLAGFQDEFLENWPWPLSSQWACALLGGSIALMGGSLHVLRQWRRTTGLAHWAAFRHFHFSPTMKKVDTAAYQDLVLLESFSSAANRLTGEWNGVPVECFDYTARKQSNPHRSGGINYECHTVFVIQISDRPSPEFEIRPRGVITKILAVFGVRGLEFQLQDHSSSGTLDRDILSAFNREYFVSTGIAKQLLKRAGIPGVEENDSKSQVDQIAEQFSLATMRSFNENPGWCVESCGDHLAFWIPKRLVAAKHFDQVLSQVLTLFEVLTNPLESGMKPTISAK